MPPDASGSVDVVLSWSRSLDGTTVVLKQIDGGGWDEVDRTDATELTVRGLNSESAYVFAAAAVEADGNLAPQDEWETLRVAPLADQATPALPHAPIGLSAAQD